MPLTQTELLALQELLAGVMNRHLAPLFKRGTQLTFAARTPGNPEADVLVTTESDLEELRKMVGRSMARPPVGEGVTAGGDLGTAASEVIVTPHGPVAGHHPAFVTDRSVVQAQQTYSWAASGMVRDLDGSWVLRSGRSGRDRP